MIMEPVLAALDQLILLLIFGLLAAVSSWLTKRREAAMAEKEGTESPGKSREVVEGEGEPDLQEVLRRLMGGEAVPRELPPALPPALPSPAPVPPPVVSPGPVRRESTLPGAGAMRVGGGGREPAPVVTKHVMVVAKPAGGGGAAGKAGKAGRGGALRGMLRTPATARQLFLAAQVFGAPRSLER